MERDDMRTALARAIGLGSAKGEVQRSWRYAARLGDRTCPAHGVVHRRDHRAD